MLGPCALAERRGRIAVRELLSRFLPAPSVSRKVTLTWAAMRPADSGRSLIGSIVLMAVRRSVLYGSQTTHSQPVTETGWRWHILADPDGNGFCVLQPPAGYW